LSDFARVTILVGDEGDLRYALRDIADISGDFMGRRRTDVIGDLSGLVSESLDLLCNHDCEPQGRLS
jgi:hypothetical protein